MSTEESHALVAQLVLTDPADEPWPWCVSETGQVWCGIEVAAIGPRRSIIQVPAMVIAFSVETMFLTTALVGREQRLHEVRSLREARIALRREIAIATGKRTA